MSGAYVRVYYSIRDDEKFVRIYDDDHHLATWLRLLMTADAVWPASADLPRAARRASVFALKDAGLIEMVGPSRFRVRGLDRERERRSNAASNAAALRWHKNGNAENMPSRAEPSIAEQSSSATASSDDPVEAYMLVAGRYPTDRTKRWLDDLARQFPPADVSRLLLEEWPEGRGAIGRVADRLKEMKKPKPVYGLRPGSPEYELARLMAEQEATA